MARRQFHSGGPSCPIFVPPGAHPGSIWAPQDATWSARSVQNCFDTSRRTCIGKFRTASSTKNTESGGPEAPQSIGPIPQALEKLPNAASIQKTPNNKNPTKISKGHTNIEKYGNNREHSDTAKHETGPKELGTEVDPLVVPTP